MSEPGKGYSFAVMSALLSGANYVLGKVVLANLSPAHLVALIFVIATLIQGIWAAQSGSWRGVWRCSARGWGWVGLFSALSIAALITLWTGVKYLDPTVAAFIGRLQTLVAIFLGIYLLKEQFRLLEGIGGLVVILGVVIIYSSAHVEMSVWFWVMVLSALLWGLTEVVAKVALRHIEPVPLSLVRTAIVAVFFLMIMIIDGRPLFNLGQLWWGVIGIALMGPTLARLVYLMALKRIDLSKASLVNQVQPLFVSVVSFTFLGVIPTLREWMGGVCILGGCMVMVVGRGRLGFRD